MRRAAAAAGAVLLLAAFGPSFAYRAGARLAARPAPGERCAVLVLGAASPELQEDRVGAAVAALRAAGCGKLVLSGGTAHSREPEADGMAARARAAGVPDGELALERRARNTWENVKYSLPELDGYARVYIVSDSLHCWRGRRYWCKQRPDLCARAAPLGYDRRGDRWVVTLVASLHELGALLRDQFR